MLKLFWLLVLLWCLLRAGLLLLTWQGNPDPAARARALAYFTEEDLSRGQVYARSGALTRCVLSYWQLALLLTGVLSGFWAAWHQRVQALSGGGFWLGGALFLLGFLVLYQLATLPFSYYLEHVLERRMGFSTMTVAAWATRYLKNSLVGWTLQIAGAMLALWVIRSLPRAWPGALPLALTAFSAAVTLLFPVLITPLFYDQKPLAEGPLKQRILTIAGQAGVPLTGVYEIDESRYSRHTNAYFTGLFSHKRVVLYDTLVRSHTVDEAALIFAHEVGHWRRDHVLKGLLLGLVSGLVGALLVWWAYPRLLAEPVLHLQPLWSAANVPFFLALAMVTNLLLAPINAGISRHFERQADAASLDLTGLAQTFIDAEVRVARDNRSDLLPHPLRVFWLYSHPPALERIAMAEAFRAKAPATRRGP